MTPVSRQANVNNGGRVKLHRDAFVLCSAQMSIGAMVKRNVKQVFGGISGVVCCITEQQH